MDGANDGGVIVLRLTPEHAKRAITLINEAVKSVGAQVAQGGDARLASSILAEAADIREIIAQAILDAQPKTTNGADHGELHGHA